MIGAASAYAVLALRSALTLVIAGWWFLRNLTLYGELLGTATMLDNFGRRSISLWQLFMTEFEGIAHQLLGGLWRIQYCGR